MLEQIAAAVGIKKIVLIAGLAGAVISLRFVSEVNTWWSRITLVICGTAFASYATPALAEWLVASERVESGLAFAIGLFGMSLAGALLAAIKEAKLAEAISSWFKRPGS
tara:strand:- start:957 stop:1283 length:327 start_codon:yes stop_codon:yes gene_type:complete